MALLPRFHQTLAGLALAAALLPAFAQTAAPNTLDARIQDVKGDVIRLNRDLLVLEEELLFPANTQVALFVSMDVGKLFSLDSVQIKLDDKVVANYLYTPLEVQALHRGGVQRVYLGNLRAGTPSDFGWFHRLDEGFPTWVSDPDVTKNYWGATDDAGHLLPAHPDHRLLRDLSRRLA